MAGPHEGAGKIGAEHVAQDRRQRVILRQDRGSGFDKWFGCAIRQEQPEEEIVGAKFMIREGAENAVCPVIHEVCHRGLECGRGLHLAKPESGFRAKAVDKIEFREFQRARLIQSTPVIVGVGAQAPDTVEKTDIPRPFRHRTRRRGDTGRGGADRQPVGGGAKVEVIGIRSVDRGRRGCWSCRCFGGGRRFGWRILSG